MTDVSDLYEPGDDREPEEDERWAPGVVPVNLDEVEQRIARLEPLVPPPGLVGEDAAQDMADLRELIGQDVPGLIADLRESRQRIAELEALEKREEWTVTGGRDVPPQPSAFRFPTVEMADRYGNKQQRQLWRRMLSVHPWEPIDSKPPF